MLAASEKSDGPKVIPIIGVTAARTEIRASRNPRHKRISVRPGKFPGEFICRSSGRASAFSKEDEFAPTEQTGIGHGVCLDFQP